MTGPLASRIALVTGGSRGIGYAIAIALARQGAHVVATARTPGGLEELDDAIKAVGGTATLVPLELRDFDGIARLAAALNERYGKLDIMVANAALGASKLAARSFPAQGMGGGAGGQRHRELASHPQHARAAAALRRRPRGVHVVGRGRQPARLSRALCHHQGRARSDGADLCQRDAEHADQGQLSMRRARPGRGCVRRSRRARTR